MAGRTDGDEDEAAAFAGVHGRCVALDAIRGEWTMAELSARHGVHATVIATWKKQAVDGMATSFSGKAEAIEAASDAEVTKLHAKIGQLVVERDFLRGGSRA